uniref:Uncharacterized protein n=1 Tax=Parascaris univalens TaxID=6257 RepID=A0A915CH31_PARUN
MLEAVRKEPNSNERELLLDELEPNSIEHELLLDEPEPNSNERELILDEPMNSFHLKLTENLKNLFYAKLRHEGERDIPRY